MNPETDEDLNRGKQPMNNSVGIIIIVTLVFVWIDLLVYAFIGGQVAYWVTYGSVFGLFMEYYNEI